MRKRDQKRGRIRSPRRTASKVLALALHLISVSAASAAGPDALERRLDQVHQQQTDDGIGFRRGSVVVAPIPFSNPTIGSGLALGGGYMFKLDPQAKTSVIGLGAMRSDNGSEALGAMVNLAFGDNRWLLNSFFGKADLHYDLYTSVGILPIRQDGTLGRLSLAYGVTPDLSFGAALRYLETSIGPEFPGLPPIPPEYQPDLGLELLLTSLFVEWDRRDDSDYPTEGSKLAVTASYGQTVSGASREYKKATVLYDYFLPVGNRGVLGGRAATCAASADTPFFDSCGIGATDNFRGFSSTQFLGQRLASLQIEYRQRFSNRLGGVAFGGAGWIGRDYDDLSAGGAHAAAGLGLRYRVSKKFPVDFSVDVTRNDLKDDLLYIYVGQRF